MKRPIVLFLILGWTAGAQQVTDQGRLTFEQAWELHRKSSPALVRLDLDRRSLRKEAEAWYKAYIPGITAQGDLSRTPLPLWSPQGGDTPRGEGELWTFRGTLNLSLALNSSLIFTARREALTLDLADLEYETQVRSARLGLKRAWIEYQSQGRNLDILRNSLSLAEARLRIIQAQHERGLKSDLELLAARIAALKDRPGVVKAEADQQRQLLALKSLLDWPPEALLVPQPLVLAPPVLPESLDPADSLADSQPEVRKARLRLELAQLALEAGTTSSLGPVVGFSGTYSSSFTLDPLFLPEKWGEDKGKDALGLGLSVRLPLDPHIPASTGALGREKLAVEVEKARMAVEEAREKAVADIRNLLLDLKVSESALELQSLSYALQEQNYRGLLESYDRGRASLQELDTARQDLLKAGQALEREDMNRLLLLLDLESRRTEGWENPQSSVR